MFSKINIHIDSEFDRLIVPKESVIRTGQQNRVVVSLAKGQFKSVEVEVGQIDGDNIQIVRGLMVGDMVVSSGQFLIDSESSKKSDFKRMEQSENSVANSNISKAAKSKRVTSKPAMTATVDGIINSINHQSRVLNISRGPIEKWARPKATMDFVVIDSIELERFSLGQRINFTFRIMDEFMIIDVHDVLKNLTDEQL